MYKEDVVRKTSFTFNTRTDVEGVIENVITSILSNTETINFYNDKFPKIIVADLSSSPVSNATNMSTGPITDSNKTAYQVGTFTGSGLRFIETGSLIKFTAILQDNTLWQIIVIH